jgi:hypothetical protein
MNDIWDKEEMLRLHRPDRNWELRYRRWDNIYAGYYEGKTVEDIARHYALSVDSIKQVLRRASYREQAKVGFMWPEKHGLRLCDFAHRCLIDADPEHYWHDRAVLRGEGIFCQICFRSFTPKAHVYKLYEDAVRKRRIASGRHVAAPVLNQNLVLL